MCTAATYHTKDHYFGRNLDLDYCNDETITVTPRNYPFSFRKVRPLNDHYGMIGVAYVKDDYPLYYDAVNEKGLAIAGLNFPDNACYKTEAPGLDNVSPFELIPWLLGQCASVSDARWLLDRLNLIDLPFSPQLPLAPLHWLIADGDEAVVVESVQSGLKVYNNPTGVLTNNPPFDYQQLYLNDFMNLTSGTPVNRFSPSLDLTPYSLGFGAIGLPGDLSSSSRFVRAAFTRLNSVSGDSEMESVSQLFHILNSVAQIRGCSQTGHGYQTTLYTSCCNTDRGIYYYNTYDNSQLSAVDMHRENLNGCRLVSYPLLRQPQIKWQN